MRGSRAARSYFPFVCSFVRSFGARVSLFPFFPFSGRFILNSIFSDGFLICAHVIPHSSHPFYLKKKKKKNKIECAVSSCFVRLKITSINPFISDSSRTRPSQNSNNMQLSILLGIPNQYISRAPPCFSKIMARMCSIRTIQRRKKNKIK